MLVSAATMRVAHTFEVVRQAKVVDVVRLGYFYPVCQLCADGRPNPKPRPYFNLAGGVWVMLLHLVPSPALLLGCGGVA